MKIHSISVLNINSLKGSFTIDFTKPPLRNCGLFAITGPTGAGKTTLLDALTLALFGDVARNAHVDNIMTYGCGECRAEVVFETPQGLFKAKWARQRARGKADGNLQSVKRELATWPSGEIIAEKINDVDKAVVEKLGLSKDQFLKSVLLAQGDFTAFLKADKNSRAELLEKMTSTDEYRALSRKAFAKARYEADEETKLKLQKGSIQVMSVEEEEEKKRQLVQLQNDAAEISKLREERQADKSWFDTFDGLERAVVAAEQRYQKAILTKENAGDVFEKWKAHQQVAPFEVELSAFFTKQNEKASHEQSLAVRKSEIERHQLIKIEHEAAHAAAEEKFKAAKAELELRRPELQNAIAEQRALNSEQEQLKNVRRDLETKKLEQKRNDENLARTRKELTAVGRGKFENANWLQEHESEKEIQLVVDDCRSQLTPLIELRSEGKGLNQQLRDHQAKRESSIKKISSAELIIEECLRESEKLLSEQEKLTGILGQWGLFVKNSKEQTEIELSTIEEQIVQRKEQLHAKEFFVQHHDDLVEGKPCPLCGSEAHPAAALDVSAEKQEIKELKSSLKTLEFSQKQIHEKRDRVHGLENQLMEIPKAELLTETFELSRFPEVTSHLNNLRDLPRKLEQTAGRERTAISERGSAISDRDTADELIRKAEQRFEELKSDGNRITGLFQQHALALQSGYSIGKEDEFISALEARVSEYSKQKSLSEKLAFQVESLQRQMEHEESLLQRIQRESETQQNSIEQLTNRINERSISIRAALVVPFENPQVYLQHLEQQEAGTSKSLAASLVLLNEVSSKLRSLEALQDDQAKKLEVLSHALEMSSSKLSKELIAAGLTEEITVANAQLLSITERKSIEEEVKKIEEELRISEHAKNAEGVKLAEHKSVRRNESTKEEILEQLNELNNSWQHLNEQVGSLKNELATNEYAQKKMSGLQEQLELQHKKVLRWEALSDLIGSSNGDLFARFAQTISLGQLLRFANDHLRRLSDRYQLRSDDSNPGDLKLMVEDRHQSGWLRDTKTLSGGESFMVSLGLALGLAEMASQNTRIDSLFIDEGFGTLDESALDDAISTLENLQDRGKTIGVISHVEQLKNRIQTQIVVKKLGNGYSELNVTYA